MDYTGARFVFPFNTAVHPWAMPIPSINETKSVAYANTGRAAWLLSQGRMAEAEHALRETISFGLQLTYEHTLIENLIGAVIVGIGRAGLEQFYSATGRDREAAIVRAKYDSVQNLITEQSAALAGPFAGHQSIEMRDIRNGWIEIVGDSTWLSGLRWELLYQLSFAPCTNVRELVFGPDPDVLAAMEAARQGLVRFPSDQHYFEYLTDTSEHSSMSSRHIAVRLSRFAGAVLGNKRLGA